VPIVLMESVSHRRSEPWLGRVGLSVFGVLLVLGAVATTAFQLNSDPFVASSGQFVGVGIAFILLIGLAAWWVGDRHLFVGTEGARGLVGRTGLAGCHVGVHAGERRGRAGLAVGRHLARLDSDLGCRGTDLVPPT
jgi:hypothetical protein